MTNCIVMIQWMGNNTLTVVEYVEHNGIKNLNWLQPTADILLLHINDKWVKVKAGDWIIKLYNGIKVCTDNEMQKALQYLDTHKTYNNIIEWLDENI